MSMFYCFFWALFSTIALALAVVIGLWRTLFELLVDICGNDVRARFWRIYAAIVLLLVPTAAVMIARSDDRSLSELFLYIDQFRWGILGLILSLFVIAMVLVSSLPAPRLPGRLSASARTEDIRRLLQKIETGEWNPEDMERLIRVVDEIRAQNVMKHTGKHNGP